MEQATNIREIIGSYVRLSLGIAAVAVAMTPYAFRRRGDPIPEEIPPKNREAWAELRERELDIEEERNKIQSPSPTPESRQLYDEAQEIFPRRLELEGPNE